MKVGEEQWATGVKKVAREGGGGGSFTVLCGFGEIIAGYNFRHTAARFFVDALS